MNKKYQVSFVVMMIMLFSLVLFYQNCAKKGDLDLGSNNGGGGGGCTTNCAQNQVTVVTMNQNGVTSNFATTDTIIIQVYNAGTVPYGCMAVHLQTSSTDINQDLAACEINPPITPPNWGTLNSPWQNMGTYWQYSQPVSALFPRGSYKACGYNTQTASKGCAAVFTVN